MSALDLIRAAEVVDCRPWPRHVLTAADWAALLHPAGAVPDDAGQIDLLALWAGPTQVHALLLDPVRVTLHAVSTAVEDGGYPALSPARPGAAWYERMIHDLWAHEAVVGVDGRPWLDHGHWPRSHPLSTRPATPPATPEPPEFLTDPQAARMQVPIGPIAGLIQDPAHLRLTMDGARILRAESRLGYAHKGAVALMLGKSPRAAARFAARLAADATVAHGIAFAQAAEAACETDAPPRAVGLRAIMLEIERIATHLATIASVADAVDAAGVMTMAEELRERVVGACDLAFGHRLMMDCVVPGGVALDILPDGVEPLLRAMDLVADGLDRLRRATEGLAMATRLRGAGRAAARLVRTLSVGGVAGRAAGRRLDGRMVGSLYSDLEYQPAFDTEGDCAARCRVRLREIAESVRLVDYLLRILPDGVTSVALPQASGEGFGCAESGRGDVWHWVRLDHGQIAAVFPRDPGWALWPLAEAVLVNAPFEDVALVRACLGLSVSGMDL